MGDSVNSLIEKVRTSKYHCLNISHRNLSVLPPSLQSLSSVSVLLLNDNQLMLPPSEILSLANSLEELVLDGNKITLLPSGFYQFQHLKCLSLNRTAVGALSQEIGRLKNLQDLWLNNCNLVTVPREIGLLENLRRLGLRENDLESLPEELGNLHSLRWISCTKNRLSHLPHQLSELCQLRYADFSGNLFENIPELFYEIKSLRVLLFSHNQIREVSDDALLSMALMVKVDLRCNPMMTKPDHWKGMDFILVGEETEAKTN